MATYVLPQVLVFQEFDLVPQAEVQDLPAFITGGHAYLSRCDIADEKALALLGTYDDDLDTCYSWPNKPAGSVIDDDYTKLCINSALLKYYGLASGLSVVADTNDVIAHADNFITNGTDVRATALKDRDVAVGDTIEVIGTEVATAAVIGICSYVTGFVADQSASNAVNTAADTEFSVVSATAYTGTSDKTYRIEVTNGALIAAGTGPTVQVTTADGTDFSGPVEILSGSLTINVGTLGITALFDNAIPPTTLTTGDVWEITATAAADTDFNKVKVAHSLANFATITAINLYIKKDIEFDNCHLVAGQFNWTQSDTELCVESGIQAYDSTWTDGGVLVALNVTSSTYCTDANKMYAHYRAWRSDITGSIESISDVANLSTAISGALHPDNELKWGVYKALSNANGQSVKYRAVADISSLVSWNAVIEAIQERTDIYGLVPLTKDKTVLDLFQAHVNNSSNEVAGRWRVLWANLKVEPVSSVLSAANSSDLAVVSALTEDDPSTSGTQYTRLRVTTANANFVATGVKAGDIVRYQYAEDGCGVTTYNEYVIDAVLNEDELRLVTGTTAAVATIKMEIHRNLSLTDQASAIGTSAGVYGSSRVRAVWPDTVGSGGLTFPGYHLCAALAGLTSGVVPQQGLTNLEIAGFDDVSRTSDTFSKAQLDAMAVSGTWIVTQDAAGNIFSRHALTTGEYSDINAREEVVTRNVDSISYYFQEVFSPYIGVANVTTSLITMIAADIDASLNFLKDANYSARLGGQLVNGIVTDLREHTTFKDRLVIGLDITIPYALNNIEVHLLV